MFQYEFEKRRSSAGSCDSRATMTTDWSRVYPTASRHYPNESRNYPTESRSYTDNSRNYPSENRSFPTDSRSYPSGTTNSSSRISPSVEKARRPLPPRPIVCDRMPSKNIVPLKVWVIASASCFAVCAALVLATVVITKWGSSDVYTHQVIEMPDAIPQYSMPKHKIKIPKTTPPVTEPTDIDISSDELEMNDIEYPILEKLSIFRNIVANRDKNKKTDTQKDLGLTSKTQIHPIHDTSLHHQEKKIEKKDQAKMPDNFNEENHNLAINSPIPEFKPTLPDVFIRRPVNLPDNYFNIQDIKINGDLYYDDYYNDENLYDDYMQSNSMTSYLIEKVQELHDWITTDPDFEVISNATKRHNKNNEFSQVLKALNESLVEGNVTIIMNKLRDLYFGENYTHVNNTRKVISGNSTDLLSFGILTLDVMLLHNIQLMAWENQESVRNKMLKDPDVFAFNALFLDPSKVEAKQNEVYRLGDSSSFGKRQNFRQELLDDIDIGKNLLENVLEIGMSTARAAIHLGRAYKNTKMALTQLSNPSNREALNTNIQNQLSRNIDGNTHALNHLQTSFSRNDSVANVTGGIYTELDCVWMLYCKNLAATAKISAPYGTMARINGLALRMLTGELSTDRALDTLLYEALAGWTELRCNEMFPRCSRSNAASIVLESILQPVKKMQSSNRAT